MNASIVLNPAASKRLIAKGVAAHPAVHNALREGRVVVALGTTNGYVVEELLGESIDRGAFAAGFIDTHWNLNERVGELGEVVLERGRRVAWEPDKILASLKEGDVLIKGGNAIDPWGIVGVLTAASNGGTIGRYVPTAMARGVEIVIPISVAKSIHSSVIDLSQQMGIGRITFRDGLPCGMTPLHGQLLTEIEALHLLYGIDAVHVTSGGQGEGRGSVSLLLYGDEPDVRRAFDAVHLLGEDDDVTLSGRA
jgi:hypothetical protein